MKALIRHFVQFKIVRYLISGGTAAAINLSLLFLLTEFVGMWYLASSVLSFIAGFTASFLFQKFWNSMIESFPLQGVCVAFAI